MPQGKLKVKTQLPKNVKQKKKANNSGPITRRANCPIQPKKQKHEETQKFKKMISKSVNKAVEEEIRSRAFNGKKTLSKAQEAVVVHNTKS